jgi:hypothetical protein
MGCGAAALMRSPMTAIVSVGCADSTCDTTAESSGPPEPPARPADRLESPAPCEARRTSMHTGCTATQSPAVEQHNLVACVVARHGWLLVPADENHRRVFSNTQLQPHARPAASQVQPPTPNHPNPRQTPDAGLTCEGMPRCCTRCGGGRLKPSCTSGASRRPPCRGWLRGSDSESGRSCSGEGASLRAAWDGESESGGCRGSDGVTAREAAQGAASSAANARPRSAASADAGAWARPPQQPGRPAACGSWKQARGARGQPASGPHGAQPAACGC